MSAARIGKITYKTNVVPLRRDVAQRDPDRRVELITHVALSYDKYVADYGEAPDAVVAVFGGVKQTARSCWVIRGDSRSGSTSLLALAHATLGRDLYSD